MNAISKIPQMLPEAEELLTMADIVRRTKYHRATIYRMIDAGTFPKGCMIGPNSRRWTRPEFREWVERTFNR